MQAHRVQSVVAAFALVGAATSLCFAEGPRQAVQLAADADAKQIVHRAVPTTVEKLLEVLRPVGLPSDASHSRFDRSRAAPFETTMWTLEATVVQAQVRADGDLYLVIRGGGGATAVAESPRTIDVERGPFRDAIRRTRQRLDARLRPSAQPRKLALRVRLTGLGFFGRASKYPRPSNGARLQPLIDVQFLGTGEREPRRRPR